MNFGKTTLAVALGIILVPFLLCGGCMFLGTLGTIGTVGTVATVATIAEPSTSTNATNATTAEPEPQITSPRKPSTVVPPDPTKEMESWIASNPKPEPPTFFPQTWYSAGLGHSTEGTLVDVDAESMSIEKLDGKVVTVPRSKMSAGSNGVADEAESAFAEHKSKLESWKASKAPLDQKMSEYSAAKETLKKEIEDIAREQEAKQKRLDAKKEALAKATRVAEEAEQAAAKAKIPTEASVAKLTSETWSKVQIGMTYNEVVSIIGSPTEELSSNQIGGIRTVMYMWKGGFVANANGTFQNGELVSKAQFGL